MNAVTTTHRINDPEIAAADMSCSLEQITALIQSLNDDLHSLVALNETASASQLRDRAYKLWLQYLIAADQIKTVGEIISELEGAIMQQRAAAEQSRRESEDDEVRQRSFAFVGQLRKISDLLAARNHHAPESTAWNDADTAYCAAAKALFPMRAASVADIQSKAELMLEMTEGAEFPPEFVTELVRDAEAIASNKQA